MDQNLLNLFLADTYTQTDALRRLRLLRKYIDIALFSSAPKAEIEWENPYDLRWLTDLDQSIFKSINRENVYELLKEWEDEIKKIAPLTIYIPIQLPYPYIVMIGQNLRQIYSRNILIEIKFDPNLIAGCALVWNGVYRDYSLRGKLQKKREEVLNIFKEFIKKK